MTPVADIAIPLPPRRHPAPVFHIKTFCDLADLRFGEAVALVDSGAVLYAFNIAAADSIRAEIRLLTESVYAYLEKRPCAIRTVAEAVQSIFPAPVTINGIPSIRGTTVQKRLRCEDALIGKLIRTGEIKALPFRQPANSSPLLAYHSVRDWLSGRSFNHPARN